MAKKTKARTLLPESLAGMAEEDIIAQIDNEYSESYLVVNPKRLRFIEQAKLLNNSTEAGSRNTKFDLKTLLRFLDALMSMFVSDKMDVAFNSTQV